MKETILQLLQQRMDKCTTEQFWAVAMVTGLDAFVLHSGHAFNALEGGVSPKSSYGSPSIVIGFSITHSPVKKRRETLAELFVRTVGGSKREKSPAAAS